MPLLAEKANLDFTNVKIIPLKGKSGADYHLRIWLEAAKDAGIPAYVLLDKNARPEADAVINARKVDRDNCLVLEKESLRDSSECDIEDFYPKDILKEALQTLYPKVSVEKLALDDAAPVAAKITAALKREPWKAKLAEYVGSRLTEAHIEGDLREVVRFLRRIPDTKTGLFG